MCIAIYLSVLVLLGVVISCLSQMGTIAIFNVWVRPMLKQLSWMAHDVTHVLSVVFIFFFFF